MSAPKHTAGPWLYVEGERLSHDAEGWTVWAVMPAIVSLESGEPVVDDAESIDPRDARLIAAAPDLLEAIRPLTSSGAETAAHFAAMDPDDVVTITLPVRCILRADTAIAKATGADQ